jgi:hypothetical protein
MEIASLSAWRSERECTWHANQANFHHAYGGVTGFDVGPADAGYNLRYALIDDEIDYYRCVGLPQPQ